jgi:hypothetical protein
MNFHQQTLSLSHPTNWKSTYTFFLSALVLVLQVALVQE